MTRLAFLVFLVQLVSSSITRGDRDLLTRLAALEQTVTQLRSVNDEQQHVISSLVESHNKRDEQLISEITNLRATVHRLGETMTSREEESSKAFTAARTSRASNTSLNKVAFHARIDSQMVSNIHQNQVIRYDVIMENQGNGYDIQQGVFTAPHSGIYIFSTSVLNGKDSPMFVEVKIVKNGDALARAHADGQGAVSGIDQGSVTIATDLIVGDKVWVALNWPSTSSVTGLGYTSFMGCLVT